MKSAKGLARIPVIVAVLVVAAGGASIEGTFSPRDKKPVPVAVTAAPEGEVPFIGEMTVTANRNGN